MKKQKEKSGQTIEIKCTYDRLYQYLSYIEKDGKVANVAGKPVYALNYDLHKVIDL